MEGINWVELFNAMDKFLIGIVERNVVMFYVVLFAIFFSETGLVFMTFLPGDSLLFVAGAVSALPQAQAQGLNVYLLMLIIITGAILGNSLNYQIGKWLGSKVYDGSIKWIDKSALDKTHAFYDKHGGKTVMIARFVPIVRSFAPLVAGASGMDYRKFQLYNVLGAVIWVVTLVYGGYLFGNVPIIKDNLGVILIVGIGIVPAVEPLIAAGAPGSTASMSMRSAAPACRTSTPSATARAMRTPSPRADASVWNPCRTPTTRRPWRPRPSLAGPMPITPSRGSGRTSMTCGCRPSACRPVMTRLSCGGRSRRAVSRSSTCAKPRFAACPTRAMSSRRCTTSRTRRRTCSAMHRPRATRAH